MPTVVYLNGQKVDYEDARISIEDRGFLFGDGLYEVVHVYKGRFSIWTGIWHDWNRARKKST